MHDQTRRSGEWVLKAPHTTCHKFRPFCSVSAHVLLVNPKKIELKVYTFACTCNSTLNQLHFLACHPHDRPINTKLVL